MNQNYNGYNNYNQNYNNYNHYNNFNEDDEYEDSRSGCSGFLGTLFAIAALITLIYILLRLLGIDAMDYIEKYLPNKNNNGGADTSEKVTVKETLKGYCSKLDENGAYLLDDVNPEDVIEGEINYCDNKICYYGGNLSDEEENIEYEKDILYSYSCSNDIYSEMPKTENIKNYRLAHACKEYEEKENYEKTFKDGASVNCKENICTIKANGKIDQKTCYEKAEESEENNEETGEE